MIFQPNGGAGEGLYIQEVGEAPQTADPVVLQKPAKMVFVWKGVLVDGNRITNSFILTPGKWDSIVTGGILQLSEDGLTLTKSTTSASFSYIAFG